MKEKTEFYEAQQLVVGDDGIPALTADGNQKWFRLGGRTLEGARGAIALARHARGISERFIGNGDSVAMFRIRHFVGTVETVE